MARHVSDQEIGNAVRSYVADISAHCKKDGASDLAVMVLMARPNGDGTYKVFAGGGLGMRPIPHDVARSLLDSARKAHNGSSRTEGGLIIPVGGFS